eukprot:TRINITY_DN19065_c0_g1_i1.p1 TRINITY_DN19065_c0_g1~~TRINITY_DN19065_c0_g1_i1.p1  ORF type:complete len:261 (+),score=49.56 TRINITY_DN19065_c0_g1_i1:160-942(+)
MCIRDRSEGTSMAETIERTLKRDGPLAFYDGIGSGLFAMGFSWTTYYFCFSYLQLKARRVLHTSLLSELAHLWIAAQAGTVTCIVVEPLWTINTRIKLRRQQKDSPLATQNDGILMTGFNIASQEGIGPLFGGLLPSLLLVSNPAIQFMCAEWIKRVFPVLGTYAFWVGAISKFVSTMVTYPLQTLKTKLQKRAEKEGLSGIESLYNCVRDTVKNGLYTGISAKLVGTVLTSAFMFFFHSILLRIVQAMLARRRRMPLSR